MNHKNVFTSLVLCSICACCNSILAANAEEAMTQHFEPFLAQLMKAQNVPGFTIGVVKHGTVVYARAFGTKNLDSREKLTTSSLFHQASLTKPVVATCIMQLVEKGKVSLDDPVIKHVPYFELNDERYTTITIRHMVTHTSGMPDVQDYEWNNPTYDDGALERYVRRLTKEKLIAAPGEKYQYSNMAYEVLGDLIAKVSGMSFEAYVQKNVLAPLKMQHSTLLKKEADPKLMSTPHIKEGDKVIVSPVYPYNRMHAPSSTLISNTVDMSRWALANLNRGELDGQRILKASTYDVMWQPGTDVDSGIGMSWKLGKRGRLQTVSHGGRDTGYRSYILLVPEESLGIVVSTNYDRTSIEPIMDAALTVALGEAFSPHGERKAISVAPSILKDYVGAYQIAPQVVLNVTLEDGRLLTQAGPQPKTEIFPLSKTTFFLKVADVRMIFERNDRGEVFQMAIRQGINDMFAKKVK
ncbi:MAG: serine hydrolase [Planctomycetes bacterium]|nr:serine hydrolase [Planctomycetota bacterium]